MVGDLDEMVVGVECEVGDVVAVGQGGVPSTPAMLAIASSLSLGKVQAPFIAKAHCGLTDDIV
ncbi:MAG: hypothetical protein J0L84_09215, partial [Verrucomicrobia bacterium]|nr:hypothetical protein [Verrucomicrobiota bacterium]